MRTAAQLVSHSTDLLHLHSSSLSLGQGLLYDAAQGGLIRWSCEGSATVDHLIDEDPKGSLVNGVSLGHAGHDLQRDVLVVPTKEHDQAPTGSAPKSRFGVRVWTLHDRKSRLERHEKGMGTAQAWDGLSVVTGYRE